MKYTFLDVCIVSLVVFFGTLYVTAGVMMRGDNYLQGAVVIESIKECEQTLPRNQNCVPVITAKPEGE